MNRGVVWDYQGLKVWQRARSLVREVYVTTTAYPADERFGLVSQTRRCSVSVAANVAEGCGRRGSLEFARFVDIAIGSAFELECHLRLAQGLKILRPPHASTLPEEVDEQEYAHRSRS